MNGPARYALTSASLMGAVIPPWWLVRTGYGTHAGRRFAAGALSTLLMQQTAVGLAMRRAGHRLSAVDALTLSRGFAAAIVLGVAASGVRDRRGAAGWMSWLAILYGAILCDWLDGPIARRRGTSDFGTVLDLEADSWLTLCTALGAVTWGELPRTAAAAPLLRYALLARTLCFQSYDEFKDAEPPWVRRIGIAQMMLYIGATAPFRGRATSLLLRLVLPIQTPLGLGALLLLHLRTWRRHG